MQLPWERLLSLIPKSLGDARKPFRADRFAKLLELAAARDSGEVLDLYMRKAFSRASAARLPRPGGSRTFIGRLHAARALGRSNPFDDATGLRLLAP